MKILQKFRKCERFQFFKKAKKHFSEDSEDISRMQQRMQKYSKYFVNMDDWEYQPMKEVPKRIVRPDWVDQHSPKYNEYDRGVKLYTNEEDISRIIIVYNLKVQEQLTK